MAGAWTGVVMGWLATLALGQIPIDLSALNANAPLGLVVATATTEVPTLPTTISPASLVLALGIAVIGGGVASWIIARRAANLKPAEALRQ